MVLNDKFLKCCATLMLASAFLVAGGLLGAGGTTEQAAQKPADKRPASIRVVTLQGPTGVGMLDIIEQKSITLPDGTAIPVQVEIASGPEILDARLIGKQADVVTIPVNQAARLYNKGVDVKLAAVNVWGVLYVLSSDPTIRSWTDLKGRKMLASGKGSATDIAFRELSRRQGLDPDTDLQLDYSFGHVEVMQLLAAGKVDLAVLPEPFVTRVLLKNPDVKVIINLQEAWKQVFAGIEQAQGGLLFAGEFCTAYPELARAFASAYQKSCLAVLSRADAPVRIAKAGLGLDEASAKASLPRLNLRYVDAEAAKVAVVQFFEVLLKADPASVGNRIPDKDFFWSK